MKLTGKAWKYGDNVNTDYIYPGRYTYSILSDLEMGRHALEDFDADFNKSSSAGDIIVAGKNWGCGSAREQAVKCLKARGIAAIVAKSFSRIYYRNAVNEGLPIVICHEAADHVAAGDIVTIDFDLNFVITDGSSFPSSPYPDYLKAIVESGGLLPYVKKKLYEQGKIKEGF